jgi:hypothetical protein
MTGHISSDEGVWTTADHEQTAGLIFAALRQWSEQIGLGQASPAPGVVFGEPDNAGLDVVWVSNERFEHSPDQAGHLIKP